MKNTIILLIAAFGFATTGFAQAVNQITILPSNPTSSDSIRIVSGFFYFFYFIKSSRFAWSILIKT